jgi:hypothetical protein
MRAIVPCLILLLLCGPGAHAQLFSRVGEALQNVGEGIADVAREVGQGVRQAAERLGDFLYVPPTGKDRGMGAGDADIALCMYSSLHGANVR